MSRDAMSAKEFDRVAKARCKRWSERSLKVARALLVDSKRMSEVAKEHGMKRGQANVLRTRFIEYVRLENELKLPAEQFMNKVFPDVSPLTILKTEIIKLQKGGYSEPQIIEFLAANTVSVTAEELSTFLRAIKK